MKQQLETYKFKSSVCLNLFRREFISTEKLSFYPGILHEDQLFMAQAYLHASRIGFICRAFFHRRVRTDSIMTRKFTWKNMEGYLTVTNELLNKIPTYPKECHYIISLFCDRCSMLPYGKPIHYLYDSASSYACSACGITNDTSAHGH